MDGPTRRRLGEEVGKILLLVCRSPSTGGLLETGKAQQKYHLASLSWFYTVAEFIFLLAGTFAEQIMG